MLSLVSGTERVQVTDVTAGPDRLVMAMRGDQITPSASIAGAAYDDELRLSQFGGGSAASHTGRLNAKATLEREFCSDRGAYQRLVAVRKPDARGDPDRVATAPRTPGALFGFAFRDSPVNNLPANILCIEQRPVAGASFAP